MKKNLIIKLLALTMAFTSVVSIPVFADDENQLLNQELEIENEFPEYITSSGKISSVQAKDGYFEIAIENDELGYIFNSDESTVIIDQSDLSYKNISDLKEGMQITAIIKGDSPTTMSIPPMTSGAVCFVINSDDKFMDYSKYNNESVNKENTLKIIIGKKTLITDLKGSKKVFTGDEIKNSECLVFYTSSTRSIPAQIVPEFVMIFSNDEIKENSENEELEKNFEVSEEKSNVEEIDNNVNYELQNVELRKEAESLGYSIKWTSNDLPVILEKDNNKAEITVGNSEVIINGEKKTIHTSPSLENGKIVISSDFIEMLK